MIKVSESSVQACPWLPFRTFQKYDMVLSLLPPILFFFCFYSYQNLKTWYAYWYSIKEKLQESFLAYKPGINLKLRVFQMGYSFPIVIICVSTMKTTCSPMFGHLFDTTIATSMGGRWPPDRQVCVWALARGIMFFNRILYSRSASLHPGV